MEKEHKQPPIGIIPRRFWVERRMNGLLEAIKRYKEAGAAMPHEWFKELAEHSYYLAKQGTLQMEDVIEEYFTDGVSKVYLVDTGKSWNTTTSSYDNSILYKDANRPNELLSMESETFRERFKPVLQ